MVNDGSVLQKIDNKCQLSDKDEIYAMYVTDQSGVMQMTIICYLKKKKTEQENFPASVILDP